VTSSLCGIVRPSACIEVDVERHDGKWRTDYAVDREIGGNDPCDGILFYPRSHHDNALARKRNVLAKSEYLDPDV